MSFGLEASLHPLTKVNSPLKLGAHQGWGAQLSDTVSEGRERGVAEPPGGAHTPGFS